MCPLFADQSANARLVEAAGAGRVVAGRADVHGRLRGLGPADVASVRQAAEAVLGGDPYRRAAARLAGEIADLPTVDAVMERCLEGARR
jgi:UDP:flavonoid glycosyltransferase YjiC (YdhE family)